MYMTTKDIDGASPKKFMALRGKKRTQFFPDVPKLNHFYNSKVQGISADIHHAKSQNSTYEAAFPKAFQAPPPDEPKEFASTEKFYKMSTYDKLYNKRVDWAKGVANNKERFLDEYERANPF